MSGWSEADLDTIDAADEIEVVPTAPTTPRAWRCRSGWSGLVTT